MIRQRRAVPLDAGRRRTPVADFAGLLARLQRDKRKKIQQERRRVGRTRRAVCTVHAGDAIITEALWDFFYRCYEPDLRRRTTARRT